MGINNSWIIRRPDLWVCLDPPGRFIDTGWKDPGVMKFCPMSHMNSTIRVMGDNNKLRRSQFRVKDLPNTWFFLRNDYFDPETFFVEATIQWGTLKGMPDALGIRNSRTTMLAAFKLCGWLGFSRMYIVGADFKMSTDPNESPYAWKEQKDEKGRKSNNHMYQTLNRRFEALKPFLPYKVFNCYAQSGLTAFPHMSFDEAVEKASSECTKPVPEEGWYK